MKRTDLAKPVRAVIYGRYSTDEQNAMSTEAQVAQCEKRATAEGWQVLEVFTDEGISGTATGNRPAYNRMYDLTSAKAFDVLLVIGVQDAFDSNSPTASMQAGFSGITSQHTIDMISKRTYAEQEQIVLRGGNAGGRAYGYKCTHELDPVRKDRYGRPEIIYKRLEIDPGEERVVQQIFKMFADEGLSTTDIAAHLNAQGVPAPGCKWDRKQRRSSKGMASAISSDPKRGCGILNNELYVGRYVWNRPKGFKNPDTGKIEYRPRPKDEWLQEARPHLRIIDDELWERARKAQVVRSRVRGGAISLGISNAKRIGGADSRYLLGSILKCGSCGARMIGDSRTDYICPHTRPAGATTICA